MEIKELQSSEHREYKTFLMEGLINDESNFKISPDDETRADFPTKDAADSFTLGAFVDGSLAGVVSFQRDGFDREKLRHKGLLFRMYVSPVHRGKGIAKELIAETIKKVEAVGDIEQINLTVVSDNSTAKSLYEKFGFKSFATEKNAIKHKGKYFTEEQMVLFLNENRNAEVITKL